MSLLPQRARPSAAASPAALLTALALLALSAFLLASCGLFGDNEPAPQVVEPPPSTAQDDSSAAGDDTPSDQDETRPVQAVAVTTSPDGEQQDAAQNTADADAQTTQPVSDGSVYVVQAGDTLASIAEQLEVRVDDLITLNGIQNPDLLAVGQVLQIPRPAVVAAADEEEDDPSTDGAQQQDSDEDEQIEPPSVELPTVAVPAATPTQVSYTQFPQPDSSETTDTIPAVPSNFLQYGAAALPWLHGQSQIEPIIDLFRAWPMPALAVGNDRIVLVDTSGDGQFSLSIVYTDPNSFGAAVPFSNLVVYDPVPGNPSRYRIGYDHALAYAREVQGIQQLSDADANGDNVRDLTFREITCDASGCVSSFYILSSTNDGYRAITSEQARVGEVSSMAIEDRTGDGALDIVVDGLALDGASTERYRFVFSAQGDQLVETLRIALDGNARV